MSLARPVSMRIRFGNTCTLVLLEIRCAVTAKTYQKLCRRTAAVSFDLIVSVWIKEDKASPECCIEDDGGR
jgi:hypothetical protein